MPLKEDVKKKVPARFQSTPEFKILLSLLEQKNFVNKNALRMFLDSEIAGCKANISRSSAVSTGQRHRRACANHLKLYTTIKTKFLPHL